MAEAIEELRKLAAEAEARGDWRAALDAKRRWFGLLHTATDVDGHTDSDRAEWERTKGRLAPRADKP
jgi:hypothetical protein